MCRLDAGDDSLERGRGGVLRQLCNRGPDGAVKERPAELDCVEAGRAALVCAAAKGADGVI